MNHPLIHTPSPRKLLPTFPRFEPDVYDHTRVKAFKECPRKYFYSMVLGRKKPEGKWASVFAWGTMVHKFAEILYATKGDAGAAAGEAAKLFRASTNPSFDFLDKARMVKTFARLTKLYIDEKNTGAIRPMSIEEPWNVMLPNGNSIGGRTDLTVLWNEIEWIRDWKTTSKMITYFKSSLDPNDQATRYIFGLSALKYGFDNEGTPRNVIGGTLFTIIQNTKTVGPEIQNAPISRTKTQLRAWLQGEMHTHTMMDACRAEDVWPMYESACSFCDYQTVCTQPSEAGMKYQLESQFHLSPWRHEETTQLVHTEK